MSNIIWAVVIVFMLTASMAERKMLIRMLPTERPEPEKKKAKPSKYYSAHSKAVDIYNKEEK